MVTMLVMQRKLGRLIKLSLFDTLHHYNNCKEIKLSRLTTKINQVYKIFSIKHLELLKLINHSMILELVTPYAAFSPPTSTTSWISDDYSVKIF